MSKRNHSRAIGVAFRIRTEIKKMGGYTMDPKHKNRRPDPTSKSGAGLHEDQSCGGFGCKQEV